ncbi:MAG TPA: tonB-system energizer ExbB [Stellaceae bacterium]|jgi:biopolymer transport protein ExbB|nr:tonB-system energizer ExbB [Stellaceae bacterium]
MKLHDLRVWAVLTAATLAATPVLAQDAASPQGTSTPEAANLLRAALPHDLSPWNMFLTADSIVKGVIIGLAFASVVTWTIGLAKAIELLSLQRKLRRGLAVLDNAASLAEASAHLNEVGPDADLVRAAAVEIAASADGTPDGIKERVGSRLERIEVRLGRVMSRGTGLLATIGATAPFVGLFGTVWGIMNSFIGISKAQTTNLAVVAPGIAEALLATAIGLVAAIPAVVLYNLFARRTAGCRALVADASAAVLRLVSRDLDRLRPAPRLRTAAE